VARSTLTDYLQNYPFWLMDVAPIEPLSIPLFAPLLGFSSITAPEISVDITEIDEANWYFKRKIVKGGDVSNITLSRASKWYDDDFNRWMLAALSGNTGGKSVLRSSSLGGVTPRRDLLLMHFLSRMPSSPEVAYSLAATGILALQGTTSATIGGASSSLGSLTFARNTAALTGAAAAAATGTQLGPFELTPRMPAKAWILYGCVPSRYKSASDFDATDSGISIQELELSVEYFDELALGTQAAPVAMGIAIANAVGA